MNVSGGSGRRRPLLPKGHLRQVTESVATHIGGISADLGESYPRDCGTC